MNAEQSKYEALWGKHAAYRAVAPGEHLADRFMALAKPSPASTVIDFGCGTGRGALRIRLLSGATVRMADFTPNCLDAEVRQALGEQFTFTQYDLTQPWTGGIADYGYCTDVLEHIPPQDVGRVLQNIGAACKRLFLCVSTTQDHMGALIGETLHLTVEDAYWWHDTLTRLGFRIDASQAADEAAYFWCSLYANGDDITDKTGLNAPDERIAENIRKNLRLDLPEICPHAVQDTPVYLLAGGPSLADAEDEILAFGKAGGLCITVNGTYKWLLDRGVRPAAQFMVDAREFNARFVDRVIPTCKYIFSSQAAHEAVSAVPTSQAWLYHSSENDLVKQVFDEHVRLTGQHREWYPISGGTTVVSRALIVLAMLGYRNVTVFGWDSCLRDDAHHAYDQPENDGQTVVTVEVGGRTFRCHPWMVVQANEVPKLVKYVLGHVDGFNLDVRGDGLIAHILNHAALLAAEPEF